MHVKVPVVSSTLIVYHYHSYSVLAKLPSFLPWPADDPNFTLHFRAFSVLLDCVALLDPRFTSLFR